jgi:hypothetical protein
MKMFDLIFSKNKRKWISFLNEVSSPMDRYFVSKWRLVIDNFCLKYNIDYEKYLANVKWDDGKLSIYQNKDDVNNCSATFRKYFANNYERLLTNRDLGNNEWFYHAFPDVAKYFEENYEIIENQCKILGHFDSPFDPNYNLNVFQFAVHEYLKVYKKLENSLN